MNSSRNFIFHWRNAEKTHTNTERLLKCFVPPPDWISWAEHKLKYILHFVLECLVEPCIWRSPHSIFKWHTKRTEWKSLNGGKKVPHSSWIVTLPLAHQARDSWNSSVHDSSNNQYIILTSVHDGILRCQSRIIMKCLGAIEVNDKWIIPYGFLTQPNEKWREKNDPRLWPLKFDIFLQSLPYQMQYA